MRNRRNKGQGVLNTSNPDWNEDRGNYGRGYQNHGYESDRGNFNYGSSEGNLGYGTSIGGRYENYGADRNYNDRGSSSENQYSRDSGFNRGRYSGDRDEGFSGYNDWRTSNYGSGSRDYLNYGSERGTNDRFGDDYNRSNYEGRKYNRGTGNFGGGTYGSDYRNYGSDYNRSREDSDRGERGWWDKTSDEVSSWFGDEDAQRRRERDRRQSVQHKGKGPKGYSRSDERIKEDINDRLSDDVFVDASEIEVTVNQGEVTLSGTVDTRTAKRRAEDLAEEVSGVKNVENRLRLASSQRSSVGTSSYGTGTGSSTIGTSSSSTGTESSSITGTTSERTKSKQTT
ncbi:MAG TPA: BON domain-containing protein [Chryseolinea sp.]|nr:BON domain-containing protein [Chryseolinea sp.]